MGAQFNLCWAPNPPDVWYVGWVINLLAMGWVGCGVCLKNQIIYCIFIIKNVHVWMDRSSDKYSSTPEKKKILWIHSIRTCTWLKCGKWVIFPCPSPPINKLHFVILTCFNHVQPKSNNFFFLCSNLLMCYCVFLSASFLRNAQCNTRFDVLFLYNVCMLKLHICSVLYIFFVFFCYR